MQFNNVINVSDLIASTFGFVALVGIYFAYVQLRLARSVNAKNASATQASFILEIYKWFTDNQSEIEFFYKLDYTKSEKSFHFDRETFAHSNDERHLDNLLYKLSFVGSLLKRDIISQSDLEWMRFLVEAILSNNEVCEYLTWLQNEDQVPNHSSFIDAIYLYEQLSNKGLSENLSLQKYKKQALVT